MQPSKVPKGIEPSFYYANEICSSMITTRSAALASVEDNLDNYMLIKYEEFMLDKPATVTRIFTFIGVPLTPEITSKLEDVMNKQYISSSGKRFDTTVEKAEVVMKKVPSCLKAMQMFDYQFTS